MDKRIRQPLSGNKAVVCSAGSRQGQHEDSSMTYNRTSGKGGTRNAKANPLPDYNKSKGSGKRRKGKLLPNAAPSSGNFPARSR